MNALPCTHAPDRDSPPRRSALAPIVHALTPAARAHRVTALLVAITLMGAADLYMTLLFVRNVGMIESNPLARLVMSHNSPALVVLWKLALTLFGVGVLYYFRRLRSTEIASWIVCAGMTILMIHWAGFAAGVADTDVDYHVLANSDDPRWVAMPGD